MPETLVRYIPWTLSLLLAIAAFVFRRKLVGLKRQFPLDFDKRAIVVVDTDDVFATKYFFLKKPGKHAVWKIYNLTTAPVTVTVDRFRRQVDGACSDTIEDPFEETLPQSDTVPAGKKGQIKLKRKETFADGNWCYDLKVGTDLVDPGIGFDQW